MSGSEHEVGGLPAETILERLQSLQGWTLDDGRLLKSYRFPDFVTAVGFVDRMTVVAEEQNHHPDLSITWGKVTVHLLSHDVRGITGRDFRLAAAIDAIYDAGSSEER
ncbi:MAG: 4a-hydroxytetrahydrobiopterin dehydratase [Candidatus Dormiibacterota bacterium]